MLLLLLPLPLLLENGATITAPKRKSNPSTRLRNSIIFRINSVVIQNRYSCSIVYYLNLRDLIEKSISKYLRSLLSFPISKVRFFGIQNMSTKKEKLRCVMHVFSILKIKISFLNEWIFFCSFNPQNCRHFFFEKYFQNFGHLNKYWFNWNYQFESTHRISVPLFFFKRNKKKIIITGTKIGMFFFTAALKNHVTCLLFTLIVCLFIKDKIYSCFHYFRSIFI